MLVFDLPPEVFQEVQQAINRAKTPDEKFRVGWQYLRGKGLDSSGMAVKDIKNPPVPLKKIEMEEEEEGDPWRARSQSEFERWRNEQGAKRF